MGMTEFIITCQSELLKDGSYKIERYRELIRCKDCKHWISPGIGYKNADLGWCIRRGHGLQKSDWFCADGEAKT